MRLTFRPETYLLKFFQWLADLIYTIFKKDNFCVTRTLFLFASFSGFVMPADSLYDFFIVSTFFLAAGSLFFSFSFFLEKIILRNYFKGIRDLEMEFILLFSRLATMFFSFVSLFRLSADRTPISLSVCLFFLFSSLGFYFMSLDRPRILKLRIHRIITQN